MASEKDNILALDDRGYLLWIRANPVMFKLINMRKISDGETWPHLAVCSDELFVLELKAIALDRWQEPK